MIPLDPDQPEAIELPDELEEQPHTPTSARPQTSTETPSTPSTPTTAVTEASDPSFIAPDGIHRRKSDAFVHSPTATSSTGSAPRKNSGGIKQVQSAAGILRGSHTGYDSGLDSVHESSSAEDGFSAEEEKSEKKDQKREKVSGSTYTSEMEDDTSSTTESEISTDSPRAFIRGSHTSSSSGQGLLSLGYSPRFKKSLIMERAWVNDTGISSLQSLIDFVGGDKHVYVTFPAVAHTCLEAHQQTLKA